MGILKFAAAIALMAGSIGLSTTASAQRPDDRPRMEHRGDMRRDHVRRDDRRYQRPHRRDVRRHNRHCKMVWRNHRRIRVCR